MTMIEKMARASFDCWRKTMDELGHHLDKGRRFEDMTDSETEFAFANARAVLEAMREPTARMVAHGANTVLVSRDVSKEGYHPAKVAFVEMIDAALNEPPTDITGEAQAGRNNADC